MGKLPEVLRLDRENIDRRNKEIRDLVFPQIEISRKAKEQASELNSDPQSEDSTSTNPQIFGHIFTPSQPLHLPRRKTAEGVDVFWSGKLEESIHLFEDGEWHQYTYAESERGSWFPEPIQRV